MIRIGSHRVFATEITIVQVVTQLTDGQRREIYLSPIIIGPEIAVLVEPTATTLTCRNIIPFQRVLIISLSEIQKVLGYRAVSGEMYACLELSPLSVEIRVNPQRHSSGSPCATVFPFSPCTPPCTTVGKFTGHLHPSSNYFWHEHTRSPEARVCPYVRTYV